MVRLIRSVRSAVVALLAAAPLSGRLHAQGWSQLPDGSVGYTANYTSTGSFYCYGAGFAPGSSCVASGNSLTLGSGGSFLTLTFTGLSQTITATNRRLPVPSLGTLTQTFSGSGPFQFPTPLNSNVLSFGFALTLTETGPATGSVTKRFGNIVPQTPTTVLPVNCCGDASGYDDYVSLPTTAAAYPFRYGAVVFNQFTNVTLRADGAPVNVSAAVGVVPEPSTVALTAGGLAVGGLVARRRRHRGA